MSDASRPLIPPETRGEDVDTSLRPQSLSESIGQKAAGDEGAGAAKFLAFFHVPYYVLEVRN